ncbi:MAG: translation initiation factor IF-3 [Chlamydiia bacterium]|nr:translation initiation factor IF-3 [Chlamydiia bacterium]
MRVNRQIRVPKVRLIGANGEQVGIVPIQEAQKQAEMAKLDLVEIAPNASPPVCKIIDFGKFRYDQTKREKESKKAQHVIRVKEIKVKPNIGDHDLATKIGRMRDFFAKGFKVKVTCMFRGREMAHQEIGQELVRKICTAVEDVATPESIPKQIGRFLSLVLSPQVKKK